MDTELTGKVAVVTGGSRGIGRVIARRLAEDGCDLLLTARSQADLAVAAEAIAGDTGRQVEIAPQDLRSLTGCQAVHDALVEAYGRIDILANVAGATQGGGFLEIEDSVWEDGFALKFYGCVRLSRLFWPLLADSKGSVVNIVGGFARTPDPDFMIGGAVNAAMANFSKALAGQGLRDDVNVNAVYPGMTQTERIEEILATRARLEDTTVEAVRAAGLAKEGVRRMGEPQDVANLVAFLCRSAYDQVTW
jgi:NAD(P)-dependent dehydrogenase (short-subunit alcohol dehydrogenase family)